MKRGDDLAAVLKVFETQDLYEKEKDMLMRLAEILQDHPLREHVPRILLDITVQDIISMEPFRALMTLPLCIPIRPQRTGLALTHDNHLELINTLKHVHSSGIYNMDIKPNNVLMHHGKAVICDWGAAEHRTATVTSAGSVGFCDFSLTDPKPPSAAQDLMALVRTIYANYTSNFVPTTQNEADFFWRLHFRKGSLWAKAMRAAADEDYEKLKKVIGKL